MLFNIRLSEYIRLYYFVFSIISSDIGKVDERKIFNQFDIPRIRNEKTEDRQKDAITIQNIKVAQ